MKKKCKNSEEKNLLPFHMKVCHITTLFFLGMTKMVLPDLPVCEVCSIKMESALSVM